MERLLKAFLLLGLVMAAGSAIADPVIEFDPIGPPMESNSWTQRWDARVPLGFTVFDEIRIVSMGRLELQPPLAGTDPAISDFDPNTWPTRPPPQWWGSQNGILVYGPDVSRLKFTLHFTGDITDPLTFYIQFRDDDTVLQSYRMLYFPPPPPSPEVPNPSGTWKRFAGEWQGDGIPASLVPEPLSMAFLGCALFGLVGIRLRGRRKVAK